jgi:hypothetical protein
MMETGKVVEEGTRVLSQPCWQIKTVDYNNGTMDRQRDSRPMSNRSRRMQKNDRAPEL